MIVRENLEHLRSSLSIKPEKLGLKHTINKKTPLLPFSTRGTERAKFVKGFQGVLGEFTRLVSGNKLKMEVNLEELIGEISESVDVSQQDRSHFEQILRTFYKIVTIQLKFFICIYFNIYR